MEHGGPAFPELYWERDSATGNPAYGHTNGMTLRDWFAGQALAGCCCANDFSDKQALACWCYQMADTMLAARGAK